MNIKKSFRYTSRAALILVMLAVLGVSTLSSDTAATAQPESDVQMAVAASEGWINLPGRADPLYIFGFVEVPFNASYQELIAYRGQIPLPSPLIDVVEGETVELKMTNVGFPSRPDLDDPHTIHWHGFPNPYAIFDGFPESSIAVPVTGEFTYYYVTPAPGTYMWHCHQEPIEHIQMGMVGPLIVRPAQDGDDGGGDTLTGNYVYNDGDGSTEYDREFYFQLGDIDTRPHDLLPAVQEFEWTEYKPDYWTLNGRSFPDTLNPNDDSLQPISSLVKANAGDRVLLRFNNLGYEQVSMQLPGVTLNVVGKDAKILRGPDGADLSYEANTLYVSPGTSLDVLFIAPDIEPTETDSDGKDYFPLKLYNRNLNRLTNAGAHGGGGVMTEVRIYSGTLDPQPYRSPNQ